MTATTVISVFISGAALNMPGNQGFLEIFMYLYKITPVLGSGIECAPRVCTTKM